MTRTIEDIKMLGFSKSSDWVL